jgi:DNA polymerase III delta' subunit
MSAILGQGQEYQSLLCAARAGRMHHGVLVQGPSGIGKSLITATLAKALLCRGESLTESCGCCHDCKLGESHSDLHHVAIPEDKNEIPVDVVRALQDVLMLLPVEGGARVVIIEPADRLTEEAQNALLKTLEEPGHHTYLLLATSRPEGLLETVRSRVSRLRVLPLSDDVLRGELERRQPGHSASDLAWASEFSTGQLGQAERLLDGENRPIFDLLSGFFAGTPGTPVAIAKAALEGASGKVDSLERARLVLWMLRALARKELQGVLAMENTGPYAARTSVRWISIIENLIDAEADLSLRIPPEQVLVDALFHIFPQPI